MPLQPGTTLGTYSVIAKIGEGGMGEVWQARFEREAKVLASLNYPNIGSIYGLEEAVNRLAIGGKRPACRRQTRER